MYVCWIEIAVMAGRGRQEVPERIAELSDPLSDCRIVEHENRET